MISLYKFQTNEYGSASTENKTRRKQSSSVAIVTRLCLSEWWLISGLATGFLSL